MKTTNALAAFVVVLLIALLCAVLNVGPVAAQVDVEKDQAVADMEQVPRYQISAFGSERVRAYYVIDTITGEIWYSVNGGPPQKQGQVKR